jgi:hypothetical protein
MSSTNIKEALLKACEEQIAYKYAIVQDKIKGIVVSLNDATKSSAGDKHETTRAMLQIEREQAGERMVEIEKTQEVLYKIDLKSASKNAHLGSLVATNHGCFFLSISLGALSFEGESYFCIGLQTPIGKFLLGKQTGETFNFRGKNYTINSID